MSSPVPGSPYEARRLSPRKTPERWDLSQSSASSGESSGRVSAVGSGRNPVKIAAKVIGLCFSSSGTTSPRGVEDLSKAYSFPSVSSNSSGGSERRLSGRSIYGSSQNSSHTKPGGMSFTISDIHKATKNFSASNKIGQGAFGTVYKGRLADGSFVAIKRANKSEYDTNLKVAFHNEISTLERVEHLNLVRFMGYLEYNDERIIVLEYVPNGTLREHLDCMHGNPLDFAVRLDIAIDVAHAVTYLHMYADQPIIHRDIKSSNILLTDNLRAKVADFGFARLGSTENGMTHVVTEVKGTVGYLDPEYLITNQLTVKSDVYSFGVLLVELVSGRTPIDSKREHKEHVTLRWAMKKLKEGQATEVLDPNVPQIPAINLAAEKILKLAYQCLSPTKQNRPSMRRCGEILWSIRKDYKGILSSESVSNSPRPQ